MDTSAVSEALREGPANPGPDPPRRAGAKGVPLPGTLPEGYEHFAYTPYGESWVAEDLNQQTTTMTHRFTGQELDGESGLYAFPARYYDPQTSRWMGVDPAMGEYLPGPGQTPEDLPAGGAYNSLNLAVYHYTNNNPLKYVDPAGEFPVAAALFTIGFSLLLTGSVSDGQPARPPALDMTGPEMLQSLGAYIDPNTANGPYLTRAGAAPRFPETETIELKGAQAAADAVTAEYGIMTSVATGSALSGSLRLRTYRRAGTDEVSGHQLDIWSETNRTDPIGNPIYGWSLVDEPDRAEHILSQNPDLMERALMNTESTGWQRFWERYTEMMNP